MTTALDFGHIPERTIGRRLRDAREDTGMSQKEFADATGLSQRSISRYEQATDPAEVKRPVLLSWAFATQVPLYWLETGRVPSGGDGLSDQQRCYTQNVSPMRRPFRPTVTAKAAA